ncbi:MAG: 50S ribosomal protein L23 [Bacteroidia bacterium]|nr:50S ribosomal protein L23 [Bacteroidia bacterium]
MSNAILLKPIISEKAETLSEDLNQYTFMVAKTANKVEIRKAVEAMYGVSVDSVRTLRTPGKLKTRNTKSGMVKGKVSSYKKAIVKLLEGEEIDFFGDI